MTTHMHDGDQVRRDVRAHYSRAVLAVMNGERTSCCGGGSSTACDPISDDLYGADQRAAVPPDAVAASFGCGNPTALADLHPGDVVLDLGSGGGIDVLLSARRVSPGGKAYGLDMTGEMLALARENQRRAGIDNAEFLEGTMERVPLPDASVDVIISNCVINLAADKRDVLREAFRVLKPGGRFAVADIVTRPGLPPDARRSLELWAGCVAGALEEGEFVDMLHETGFVEASIETTREYTADDARTMLQGPGIDAALAGSIGGRVYSGFVRARKPEAA